MLADKHAVLIITLIAVAGCATAARTDRIARPDAVDYAAAAAEKLAAVPIRCDSIGGGAPWVKFLRVPERVTNQPRFDILSKSEYPAAVRINGQTVKQYRTGIFFATVSFDEGVNRITAEATYPDGKTAVCEHAIFYDKRDTSRQPYPLWVESRSIEPAADLELLTDEVVKVNFRGSKGQDAWIDVHPGKRSIKAVREDFDDYSNYRAEIPARGLRTGVAHTLSIRLVPAGDAPVKETYRPSYTRTIIVRNPEDFPLVKVKNLDSRLVYNLGAPRLGGPIRSEFAPGVILKVSGKTGSNYRIRLSNTEAGFVSENDVALMS